MSENALTPLRRLGIEMFVPVLQQVPPNLRIMRAAQNRRRD